MSFRVSLGFFYWCSRYFLTTACIQAPILYVCSFCAVYMKYMCNVLHEIWYANYNTKIQQSPRASKSQLKWTAKTKAKRNQSQPKAMSHKPSEGKWRQVKPSEAKAKSQKPKAKWARKWEILAPKCMQNTDFSSKMQQIARKAAPGWKAKKNLKKYPPNKSSRMMRSAAIRFSCW